MKFGVAADNPENVDFILPPDGPFTQLALKSKSLHNGFKVYVGASKWGEKTWKGKLYPKGTADKDFLKIYRENFNAVEFSSSFYNQCSPDLIKKYADETANKEFLFCPKFFQGITHVRRLTNAEKETHKFYESISEFGDNLGPLMLQLSNNFSPKSFSNLKAYLNTLPDSKKVVVEVRHADWFKEPVYSELMQLLYDLNIGTIISDTAGRRDAVHLNLTTPDAFIRFVGNDLAPTDYTRFDDWIKRIKAWSEAGLENLYFFMHQDNEEFVPEACIYFINKLNASLGVKISPPSLIEPQAKTDLDWFGKP